jgi:hydrogenase/urease accessory protein HupE
MKWLLAALLALVAHSAPARADDLRPGFLELTQRDAATWHMVWKAPIIGGLATRSRPALPAFCTLGQGQPRLEGGSLVVALNVHCTRPLEGQRIGLAGMETGFTDALLRIAPLGQPVQAERLTPDAPYVTVATAPDRWQVARTYFDLGVEHILAGYDHLLFVLALVLLIRRGWQVAKTVTAFTVAHSITLALTTLGFTLVARKPVEICIALSIVFLAVEIVKSGTGPPRLTARIPWLVAFAFGLLHGFGFAAALSEIGLPQGELPTALLAFNLGVEAGQLLIVSAALAVLWLIDRYAAKHARKFRVLAAYLIGTTAAFWMIQRAIS